MFERINLAMVPRNNAGHIDFRQIPSVPVRVMVAEEEIQKLERWLKRIQNPTDALRAGEEELEATGEYLEQLKAWYSEWQALLAEPG